MFKRKINKMDFDAVCRTCLGNMSLKPIFPLPSNHKAFSKAISLVTGVKIAINDGFPQNICLLCLKRVNDAIKFKAKCRQTDQILREINDTINKLAAMNNHIPADALNTNNAEGNSDDIETDDDDCNTNYEIEIDYADNGTSAADNNINFKHLMEQHALGTKEKENSNETKTISLDKVKVEALSDDDLSSDDNTPLKYLEKQCTLNEKETENIGTNMAPVNIVKMEPMSEDDDDKPLNYLREKSLNRRQKECSDKTDTVSMPILKKEIESDDDLNNAHDDDSVMLRNFDNKQDHDMNVENQNDTTDLTTNTDDIKIAVGGNQNEDGRSSHNIMNLTGGNKTIINDHLKINYFRCLYDKDPQDPSGEIVICKICDKRISIWGIHCHLAKAHANMDPRRVKCKVCDRYIMKCKMRKHVLELHGTGTLCCKFCKKSVKEKSMPEHLETSCSVKLRQKHRIETATESQDWITTARQEIAAQFNNVNEEQPKWSSDESISYIRVPVDCIQAEPDFAIQMMAVGDTENRNITIARQEPATQLNSVNEEQPEWSSDESIAYIKVPVECEQAESEFAIQMMPLGDTENHNSNTFILCYDSNTPLLQDLATIGQSETSDGPLHTNLVPEENVILVESSDYESRVCGIPVKDKEYWYQKNKIMLI